MDLAIIKKSIKAIDKFNEELRESLKYDKRRLNKAWRVWRSENPDAELERDTDDED